VVSVTAFGAPVPKSPAGLALSCLMAIGGLFALGLLIAALAPTANSVNAIGRLALFPLLFFAGLWLPRAIMPAVLLDISNYSPLLPLGVRAGGRPGPGRHLPGRGAFASSAAGALIGDIERDQRVPQDDRGRRR
jgi:hypothetical protein